MAIKYTNPYQQAYMAAEQELGALVAERGELTDRLAWVNDRISDIERTMTAMQPLTEDEPDPIQAKGGLTHVCREILKAAEGPLTGQEVRQKMETMGLDITGYTNPMAVLHSTLKRIGNPRRDAKLKQTVYTISDGITDDDVPF